ncbi:MAG: GatB/YqeY domain-containing protein [Hyphomicrobium sp.]
MRDRLNKDIQTSMKSGDKTRLSTLRLMHAAIKERDLSIQGSAGQSPQEDKISDLEILSVFQKMVKQRRESIDIFRKAGRNDLADKENQEILIIEDYLPQQMNEEQIKKTIDALMEELQISSVKDMGRAMGALKTRHSGMMDFSKASTYLKQVLK